MGSNHQHTHGTTSKRALAIALALTGTFLIVEAIAGFWTGSLALISDAAHMLTDTAGLAIALAAINIGERPADSRRTFGYQRFEILAAAFNAVILFLVAGYILYEGYQRFVKPQDIQSLPMIAVATIGLGVNFLSMRLLSAAKDSSLNVKGAYLEVWSDMLGSIGVIVAGLIIWLTDWRWVDPLVAIGIGLWVLPRTWALLKETINVLLEGVPDGIDLNAVRSSLLNLAGVHNVHDLHVWALTSNSPSLSAHLVLVDGTDADVTRSDAAEILEKLFHIEHVTLQTERTDCRDGREHHGLH